MTATGGVELFVAGALFAALLLAAAFFARFWSRTRDGFFAAFALAFVLLAANQVATALTRSPRGENAAAYLLRLAAFTVIILAVLAKNAPARDRKDR